MRLWKGSLVAPLLTLLLTAVLPASLGVAAATDPATVVQRYIDARNRYDVAGTLALVTDDFRLVTGPKCTPASPCLGPAGLRAELADYIGYHDQETIIGDPQVSGTTVRLRAALRSDVFRAAGVERLILLATAEVRDGKLASYSDVPDTSDAQTAQFLASQGAPQGPPSAPPRTGGGDGAAYIRRLGDG